MNIGQIQEMYKKNTPQMEVLEYNKSEKKKINQTRQWGILNITNEAQRDHEKHILLEQETRSTKS